MQAFEATGTINTAGRLTLDQPLQVPHPGRIRLIVLLEEEEQAIAEALAYDKHFVQAGFQALMRNCQGKNSSA